MLLGKKTHRRLLHKFGLKILKRIYLSGQRNFGNRGCEAIVRSTVLGLNKVFEKVEILIPSDDIVLDQKQWPEASQFGVKFVDVYFPLHTRPWANIQRLPFKFLKQLGWPFPFPKKLIDQLSKVDAVLSVGGDNYSLNYRIPSLLSGIDQLAMSLGKPVFIWGASVGPFEAEPDFVPKIREHLANMEIIFARESISYNYLTKDLGLENVTMTTDPAFALPKETFDTSSFWSEKSSNGVLGLNISPLIESYKKNGQDLKAETIQFIRDAVARGYQVLLIPHVIPLDGSSKNNDATYMATILNELHDLKDSIKIMPAHLNASQIKSVISKLRFFIGARTHATIAALSSGVPTVSISYSVKAKGINQDLLGDMPVVLSTDKVSALSLMTYLIFLEKNESLIKSKLESNLPEWMNKHQNALLKMKSAVENG